METHFNQPQRQSAIGVLVIFLEMIFVLLKNIWPIVVITLLKAEGKSVWVGLLIALGIFVAALWACIAVTIKRLRDAGLNTWWTLAILIPYLGTIATIVFGVIGSKE